MQQVKTNVKQAFASAANTYDKFAHLQRQAGRELWQTIGELPNGISLLDLGCGTGFMLAELVERQHVITEFAIALDIAVPMLHVARQRLCHQQNIVYVCADADQIPLKPCSVDMVVSNLTLQWCRDLAVVFNGIHRILKPGGRFEFNTFGAGTLQELKQAWQEVDNYQHVNEFYRSDEISAKLKQAGFAVNELVVKRYRMSYLSVFDLMQELKQLGARTVMGGRNPNLCSKMAMQQMIAAYQKKSDDPSVPATFEVVRVSATNPL